MSPPILQKNLNPNNLRVPVLALVRIGCLVKYKTGQQISRTCIFKPTLGNLELENKTEAQ